MNKPKMAETAQVHAVKDTRLRRLFIDGEEFPFYTDIDGISYERQPGEPFGYLTVRIPVERYSEKWINEAEFTHPAAMLRRADVLGDEARQPADFTARLVDDYPDEQGPEGP